MSASKNSSSENVSPVFDIAEEQSSEEGPPMSEWSSLILYHEEVSEKRDLYSKGLYSPGSGEICTAYVALSDSDVFRHVYYNYPALLDPGITEAILDPEKPIIHKNDGQSLYLALCEEMKLCPVRLFYCNLLNDEINLSYYCVDPQGIRAMAVALNNNTFVYKLILTDNFLNDDACYHLGQMLNSNVTLKELNLKGCRIGASGLLHLGETMYLNKTLQVLNLARNNLGEQGGLHLAEMLMFGMPIKELILTKNDLGRQTAVALAEAFDFKDRLTHVDISWNNLYHAPTTYKLLESMSNSIILSEINLSWNALEGERVADGIRRLFSIKTLTVLDISNNRLSDSSIPILLNDLNKAQKLITLDLSFNPMTPNDANVALEKMLRGKVKLQNLLMTNVWVNKTFIALLARVKNMKSRKNFTVTYGGVHENWTIEGPDAREVILRRADYLGNLNKRNKVDIALFFMALAKRRSGPISCKEFIEICETESVPLGDTLIDQLAATFPGPKSAKAKLINIQAIVEYIRRMWPNKKLPVTPPPEPDPVVQPSLSLPTQQPQTKDNKKARK